MFYYKIKLYSNNIMNWIYILVLCLSIYYIVARYLEKHLENFDPSLVPVSSIVTLAKIAQKLVDGNGTLTNPSNLQIGNPGVGTTGNLRVTGTTTLDGATTVGAAGAKATTTNLTVNGGSTITGNLIVTSNLTVNGAEANIKNLINLYSNTNKNNIIHAVNNIVRIANEGGDTIIEFRQDKNVKIDSGNILTPSTINFYKETHSSAILSLMGGIDTNGFFIYSPDNRKSARFSSENNGAIAFKDFRSVTKFSVDENGIAYSDGINTKSAQINGNLNITGNLKNDLGLTYMPIIARGTIIEADNGATNGRGTNLVNCTLSGWDNGQVTITFITKPPNANYCFLATQNHMNMAVFRVDIVGKTTTSCRVNTNQTQSTHGALINCDFIII